MGPQPTAIAWEIRLPRPTPKRGTPYVLGATHLDFVVHVQRVCLCSATLWSDQGNSGGGLGFRLKRRVRWGSRTRGPVRAGSGDDTADGVN